MRILWGVICNTIPGFETDFFCMTKSVIIRLIPFIFLRKYEQFFIDQFGTFDYKHANSILVTTL
jgi:hypothetical protein